MDKKFRVLMTLTEDGEDPRTEAQVKRVIKALLGGHFAVVNIVDCDEVKLSGTIAKALKRGEVEYVKVPTAKQVKAMFDATDRAEENCGHEEDPERFDGMS